MQFPHEVWFMQLLRQPSPKCGRCWTSNHSSLEATPRMQREISNTRKTIVLCGGWPATVARMTHVNRLESPDPIWKFCAALWPSFVGNFFELTTRLSAHSSQAQSLWEGAGSRRRRRSAFWFLGDSKDQSQLWFDKFPTKFPTKGPHRGTGSPPKCPNSR